VTAIRTSQAHVYEALFRLRASRVLSTSPVTFDRRDVMLPDDASSSHERALPGLPTSQEECDVSDDVTLPGDEPLYFEIKDGDDTEVWR
jgi:hypothetical protein